jgi:putative MATE family efflux protein
VDEEKGEEKVDKKSSAVLLTEGPIWKRLIAFAIPIFLGNLFQQLYNTADSMIVGNFVGSNALAAVSSSGNLIFLMVGFFNGVAMGAGVVIARYYGARKKEEVARAVHTMAAFGVAAGILLTVIGMVFTPFILRLMGTPEDVLGDSVLYFRVYFAGSLGFVMYNVCVGILRAVGDSKHPLWYLIFSSILNVVLDLLLIAGLGMGVGAAAAATVISQFASAALCFCRLLREKEEYRIVPAKVRFHGEMLKQIISNGLPSGVQNSITALANVVVQANINVFGKDAMAGCGAYSKIEGFGFLPITCFALALTTFISQNLGAKQYDRVKKGARFGILCSILVAELVGIGCHVFAPQLIGAFNDDPQVIAFGVSRARICSLFFFLLAFSHCLAGIFRGAGRAVVPMLVMMACWCGVRISYITIAVRLVPQIETVFWAYPLTWALSSVIFLLYFFRGNWLHGFERQEKKRKPARVQ